MTDGMRKALGMPKDTPDQRLNRMVVASGAEGQGQVAIPAEMASTPGAVMTAWGFGLGKDQYITSVDESGMFGKSLVFKLLQSQGAHLDQTLNNVIKVQHWLISPVELESEESGELVRCPLLRMLGSNGVLLQTTSKSVCDGLLLFAAKIRQSPWVPDAQFIPRKISLKGGKGYYILEPDLKFEEEFVKMNTKKQ